MPKIVINIENNDEITITYESFKYTVYPICNVNNNKFTINTETNKDILILISNFIHQTGLALREQLIQQKIAYDASNKPTKKK